MLSRSIDAFVWDSLLFDIHNVLTMSKWQSVLHTVWLKRCVLQRLDLNSAKLLKLFFASLTKWTHVRLIPRIVMCNKALLRHSIMSLQWHHSEVETIGNSLQGQDRWDHLAEFKWNISSIIKHCWQTLSCVSLFVTHKRRLFGLGWQDLFCGDV